MSSHDHRHHHLEHAHDHDDHQRRHENHHPHDDDHHEHGSPARLDSEGKLSDRTKLIKVLEHWIHHNEDHAKSYVEWAERARGIGEEATGSILEGIAAEAIRQNEKLQEALKLMHGEATPR